MEKSKQINSKNTVSSYIEAIGYMLSFSFSLVFGGKLLKLLWISLIVVTYFFTNSFWCSVFFTIAIADLMIFIVTIFYIGFMCIMSRNRD